MHGRSPAAPPSRPRRDLAPATSSRFAAVVGGGTILLAAGVMTLGGGGDEPDSIVAAPIDSTPVATAAAAAVTPAAGAVIDSTPTVEEPVVDLEGCQLADYTLKVGAGGESVTCLQKALMNAGTYDGAATGQFDDATKAAVEELQAINDLYVDGIVGKQTATFLGIWPGDDSFVVRTPPPPAGATDLLGYPLSPVASAGSDAPPVPADTGEGTGKRIVYSRAEQRVWAIDDQERVVRSYLVTGSQYGNEVPGKHEVYSRSEWTTAWNGQADLHYMVRWLDTERGAIGFHEIPTHHDGSPYQTLDELGTRLSGGCQRQTKEDAAFMWKFGEIGTDVYVV